MKKVNSYWLIGHWVENTI